jgi:hypothetical protein
MNKHLTDGQLRAALDDEMMPFEKDHLEACSECQVRKEALQKEMQITAQQLAFLMPHPEDAVMSTQTALIHIEERLNHKENSIMKKIFQVKYRPIWALGTLIALMALLLSFPTMRVYAEQLLKIFRVQQITVLPLDSSALTRLTGDQTMAKQLSQIVSDSIGDFNKPGKPNLVNSAAEASQAAGYTVRLPGGSYNASQIAVQNAWSFSVTIDQKKAQGFLDEAGRSDIVIPTSVDGEKVSVSVPASVTASFGTCPKLDQEESQTGPGTSGRQYPDCIIMVQMPSPTVDAPQDLDVAKLAELGLQFTGMTAQQAHDFSQTVDWTSSLVIPIPTNAATYSQVQVDGVTGSLIQRPADDAPQFGLVWVKNGIIYAFGGLGTNSAKAIDMANALQ